MASVELEQIKQHFSGRCRIVDGASDTISKTITIQPKDLDLTIKFGLTDDYPETVPQISVRSTSVSDEDVSLLLDVMKTKAAEFVTNPMIHNLITEAENWLNGKGVGKGVKVKRPQPKKSKSKKNTQNEVDTEIKQASMKTSEDVIKRIQWDSDLPQEDFLVGYIDRFLGIQEKYFSAFSWEDISSVDYNVLAIPKHRIQYFKYKDVKVWDKTEKLDNVFGSLGSGKTIVDVIKNYTPMTAELQKLGLDKVSAGASSTEAADEDGDSDDSDDGIVVTLGAGTGNTITRPYLDHLPKRPTHFLALRIDNSETVQRLVDVQTCLKTHRSELESGMMPSACFHVTLCTLGLDDEDQIREAIQMLTKYQSELSKLRPSESLKLIGVDNFYNRTVYAKIKYPRKFLDFVEYLKLCFLNAGIEIRDGYGFVPHITLLKVSKQTSRTLGQKFLICDAYRDFKDSILGSQSVDKLSLCIMGNQRQEDGFWVSLHDTELNC